MTKTRGAIYVGLVGILLSGFFFIKRRHDVKVDAGIVSQTLPKDDASKTIIDVEHHQIKVVRRDGGTSGNSVAESFFLGPQTSVEVKKDGQVVVTTRSWGTQRRPFVSLVLDNSLSVHAGVGLNGFYVRRWDMGGGLSLDVRDPKDARLFIACGYNFYSNTSAIVTVDNHKAVGLGLAIKF